MQDRDLRWPFFKVLTHLKQNGNFTLKMTMEDNNWLSAFHYRFLVACMSTDSVGKKKYYKEMLSCKINNLRLSHAFYNQLVFYYTPV